MSRPSLLPLGLTAAIVAFALTVGCNKKASSPAGGAPPGPTTPPNAGGATASPGRGVFESQGCVRCHSIGAPAGAVAHEGGKGGWKNKGPDLGKVGADPAHTKDWFAAYIRDPKSQNPSSRMPPFGGKINDDDMGKLTDYLTSLK